MDFDAQKIHFDVVIRSQLYETWKDLWRVFNKHCKKFDFQKEKGEIAQNEHWQCRVTMHKKQTAFAMTSEIIPQIGGRWLLTSTEGAKDNRYVTKWPTRIEGPYSHQTPCPDEVPMTKDIKTFIDLGMKPWHTEVLKYVKDYDERHILGIYDPKGNNIKTTFLKYLNYKGYANLIPATCDTAKQMMEFCFGQEARGCYMINIPRAMKQDGRALAKIYTAIECIKDGTLYDTRYKSQEKIIERPQIIVVFNDLPDFTMLSLDRWLIMELDEEGFKMKKCYDYMKKKIEGIKILSDNEISKKSTKIQSPKRKKEDITEPK